MCVFVHSPRKRGSERARSGREAYVRPLLAFLVSEETELSWQQNIEGVCVNADSGREAVLVKCNGSLT